MHDRGVYHFANGDFLEGVWQEVAMQLYRVRYLVWVFLKYGYPQIIHLNKISHYKPSILGYPPSMETPSSAIEPHLSPGKIPWSRIFPRCRWICEQKGLASSLARFVLEVFLCFGTLCAFLLWDIYNNLRPHSRNYFFCGHLMSFIYTFHFAMLCVCSHLSRKLASASWSHFLL